MTSVSACPGGDAGSGVEAGCPEYGIFHSAGVAERHGFTAVSLKTYVLSFCTLFSRLLGFLCL